MSKNKKDKYHNPYCILVLKGLIESEVRRKKKKKHILISDIEDYVINFKSIYGEPMGRPVVSTTLAERVRKLWSRKVFDFPTDTLDMMCEILVSFDNVKSWEDFIDIYYQHDGGIKGNQLRDTPFDEYAVTHPNDFEFINASADIVVGIKRAERALLNQIVKDSDSVKERNKVLEEIVQASRRSEFEEKIVCWILRILRHTSEGSVVSLPNHSSEGNIAEPYEKKWINTRPLIDWRHRVWLKIMSLYYMRNHLLVLYFQKKRYKGSHINFLIIIVAWTIYYWWWYFKKIN